MDTSGTQNGFHMTICELLTTVNPYGSLNSKDRQRISKTLQRREYQAGELLQVESARNDYVGFIFSGRAEAYLGFQTPSQRAIQSLRSGDFFGDLACLTDRKALVSIVCHESSIVCMQTCQDFMRSLQIFPNLKTFFLQSAFDKLWYIFQVAQDLNRIGITNDMPDAQLPVSIKKAVQFIDSHYDCPITLEQVSRIARMSRSTFSRRFKQSIGVPFKTYLNKLRIGKAKHLMSKKGMNVTEACFAVGFNDVAYFSRTFHKIEGISPSQYKNTSK